MHKKYDPEHIKEFEYTNVCVICIIEFKQEDDVTPLPCNAKHYYHSECIEHWLQ